MTGADLLIPLGRKPCRIDVIVRVEARLFFDLDLE
jgi:hypothetical protein